MNRQELINAIADDTEESKVATGRFLDSFLKIVQAEVAQGGVVRLTGFGTFEKTTVAGRVGRNPKTGEAMKIDPTSKPKFTPGANFKELVKG